MPNRCRIGIQSGIGTASQIRHHAGDPLRVILNPCAQPAADVSAAGNGGEIVKLVEQAAGREALQNPEPERCATNAAA